jgi:hypothetical protein
MKTLLAALAASALAGAAMVATPALAQAPQGGAAETKLSVQTGIKTLLADEKAKEILTRYAPMVVEFFASGQADGMVPGETPLATIAENPMAADAGLSPDNMRKIAEELAAR